MGNKTGDLERWGKKVSEDGLLSYAVSSKVTSIHPFCTSEILVCKLRQESKGYSIKKKEKKA